MKLKVLCCSGAGMGTCMLLKNKADEAIRDLKWRAKIDCESVAIAKTIYQNYDVVLTNHNLTKNFTNEEAETEVIGLENVMSTEEIKEKLASASKVAEKANK